MILCDYAIFYKDWSGTSLGRAGPPELVWSSHGHPSGPLRLVLPPRLGRSDYSEPCQYVYHLPEREGNPEDLEESGLASGMMTPRSNNSPVLETVVESCLPVTPAISTSKTLMEQVAALVNRQQHNTISEEAEGGKLSGRGASKHRTGSIVSSIAPRSQVESESESGYKSKEKAAYANNNNNNSRAPPLSQRFASRPPTVMRSNNLSRNMTVEKVTLSSVLQVTVGAVGVRGGQGWRAKKAMIEYGH